MTDIALQTDALAAASAAEVVALLGQRSIVLTGMMGVGKSSIGRRLAARLGVPFVDADTEIEKAAGMSIADIFARHGEADFRSGEARVIARLLEGGPQVLATGGGAVDESGHAGRHQGQGHIDLALRRVGRPDAADQQAQDERPLLQTADPAATLQALLTAREPIYAQADITVQSREVPHRCDRHGNLTTLAAFLNAPAASEGRDSA